MDQNAIQISGLTKYFGDFRAVDNLDLTVGSGEILALLGPSGCGKTTTLRMVSGLERQSAGEIRYQDRIFSSAERRIHLPPEKRNVGMVFQSYALWPHMTVAQNVAYPLKIRHENSAEIRSKVDAVLALMDLGGLGGQTIPQLSGGQQQRVALARALVYQPTLMLFDEPFSNLDAQLRTQMRMELKSLRKKVAMTGLFVTHDQVEALSLADRVAIMNQGKIEQVGTPSDVYEHPKTKFVRDFLGKVVNLSATVEAVDGGTGVTLALSGIDTRVAALNGQSHGRGGTRTGWTLGDRVEISIRPEDLTVTANAPAVAGTDALPGIIDELLFTGDSFEARILIGNDPIVIELPPKAAYREGQKIYLGVSREAISLWPASAGASAENGK